jgi:cytochrome P450
MLPAVRRDPIGVFMDAARRFGDVAYLQIGSRHGFLATNPADIRHVLADNARNYRKSPLYNKLTRSLGQGLITSEGSYWLRQRRLAQPAFHRQRVAAFASVMTRSALETVERWRPAAARGASLDIGTEMMLLTQAIILRTLLGTEPGAASEEVGRAWPIVNRYIGESFWSLGLTDGWPTPKNRRFERARQALDRVVFRMIDEHRQRSRDGTDLLSMLIAARDEDTGEAMTDVQLRDEVMTFLLAGHETTALALAWTWYLLSQHPESQARLEAEVDAVLGGRTPELADLDRLPFARMVIEESMRLYPPAWGFSRQAIEPDVIGGYPLPAGWLVFVLPYVMHRHPAYWEDPDQFDPTRFTPERVAARPKFVYLPFGAGPRQCLGNQFAMLEAHLLVATLTQHYRLHLAPGHRVETWPLITLHPRYGMKMIVESRRTRNVEPERGTSS